MEYESKNNSQTTDPTKREHGFTFRVLGWALVALASDDELCELRAISRKYQEFADEASRALNEALEAK